MASQEITQVIVPNLGGLFARIELLTYGTSFALDA